MTKIIATYKIITPMFVSGTKSNQAELRIPSIKGAIRFWWRALNWDGSKCEQNNCCEVKNADKKNCECACTQDLYVRESAIFGSSDIGQSKVLFSFIKKPTKSAAKLSNKLQYLGYGIDEESKGVEKSQEFTLKVLFKSGVTEEQITGVKNAMVIWGLLGGLGKRSRKGFGSIAIQSMSEGDFSKLTLEDYKQKITKIVNDLGSFKNTNCLPYSAFSKDTEIWVNKTNHAEESKVHECLQKKYKKYRGCQNKDENRCNDKTPNKQQRKASGTPVIFKDDTNNNSTDERRASPVFLHIHPIQENNTTKYIGVRLYLPTTDKKDDGLIKSFLRYDTTEVSINVQK